MIDLSCHLLPDADNGPKSLYKSLEIAETAVKEGITTIMATPHHLSNVYINPKEVILAKVDFLQAALLENNIPLSILPGQLPFLTKDLLTHLEKDELLSLNNRNVYLLLEFPPDHIPPYAEQVLFDLQMKGLTPIIASPERNKEIIEKPELLYRFIKGGALAQISSASIAGKVNKTVQKTSFDLIEANLAHFVASNLYKNEAFNLKRAYSIMRKKFGKDIEYLFKENAEYLVEGKSILREPPQRVSKKKKFVLF